VLCRRFSSSLLGLKDELTSTMQKIDQLKLGLEQKYEPGNNRKMSDACLGGAEVIDMGDSRSHQMVRIEKMLMGQVRNSRPEFSRAMPVTDKNRPGFDVGEGDPWQFQKDQGAVTLAPGQALDKDSMQSWYEIFSHRTRPQHPGVCIGGCMLSRGKTPLALDVAQCVIALESMWAYRCACEPHCIGFDRVGRFSQDCAFASYRGSEA
jgi:hypothetical protein